MGDLFVTVKCALSPSNVAGPRAIDANSARTRDFSVETRATVGGQEHKVYMTPMGWDTYQRRVTADGGQTTAVETTVAKDATGWRHHLPAVWPFGGTPAEDAATKGR